MSVSAAAKDAGIHETTIYGWLGTGAAGVPSWTEYAKLKRENKALLELVGEITFKLLESKKRIDPEYEGPVCPCGITRHAALHALLPKEITRKRSDIEDQD